MAVADKQWLQEADGGRASYTPVPGGVEDERTFEWEQLGEPLFVFSYTTMVVGRQCIALTLLALQVFSTSVQKMLQQMLQQGDVSDSKSFLMNCDEEAVGFMQTLTCETTKAFVWSFAPVSIIVAPVVASQLILCQRLFYTMIRSGVLVDFKNLSPFKDPLFWWVLLNGVLAMSHFVFHMLVVQQMHIGKDNLDRVIASLKQDLIFFGFPAILYVLFLYMSYDVEWLLLPLSKFWEADPEWAHRISSDMVFVTEKVACKTMLQDATSIQDVADTIACQAYGTAELNRSDSLGTSNHAGSGQQASYVPQGRQEKINRRQVVSTAGPRTYFIERAWIARLLSNTHLVAKNQKCHTFYLAWLAWMFITSLVCLVAVVAVILQLKNDIEDLIAGQRAEYLCVAIVAFNVIVMITVGCFYVGDLVFP